jgi:parallel beta-helix repeat protein
LNVDDGIDIESLSQHNMIFGNTIEANGDDGFDFDDHSHRNTIYGNDIISNLDEGITLWDCSSNRIYRNNFVGNTRHVESVNAINYWNASYENGGGNYWSNYTGEDKFSGPNQDQLGPDGIGDTMHALDADNSDGYPLMDAIDSVPKLPSSILMDVHPLPLPPYIIPAGTTLTVDGHIFPDRWGVPVTIRYILPNATVLNRVVLSDGDGQYTDDYTLPPVYGSWSVTASWAGDSTLTGATSTSRAFVVEAETRLPIMITVRTDGREYCEHDDIVISGVTDPPLSDVPIYLAFSHSNGVFTSWNSTTTDASGAYQVARRFSTTGSWSVVASYPGDLTFREGSSDPPAVFTVNDANFLGICCFIATATYGSAMAPEVQFLRNFRAETVLTTFTGRQFMAVFNGIYYRFSPTIASGIASNEGLRTVARGVLFPLIRILQIGEWVTTLFRFNAELGIVAFVLVVSALLSLVYLVPWALLVSYGKRRLVPATVVRRGRDLLMGSLGLLLLVIALQVSVLTMVAGALTVLITVGLTVLTVTRIIIRRLIII